MKKAFRENRPCAKVLKVTNIAGAVAVTITRIGKFEWPGAGNGEATVALIETGGNLGSITTGAANKDGFETKFRPEESTNVMFKTQSDPSPAHPSPARTCDHKGQLGIFPILLHKTKRLLQGLPAKILASSFAFPPFPGSYAQQLNQNMTALYLLKGTVVSNVTHTKFAASYKCVFE